MKEACELNISGSCTGPNKREEILREDKGESERKRSSRFLEFLCISVEIIYVKLLEKCILHNTGL